MRYGDLACLVTALLGVRDLVFNLNCAGTGFDHALGQQVGCFFITKASVDVSDNRHDMSFVVVDALNYGICIAAICASLIQLDEHMP